MSLMIVAFEAAPKVDLDYKKHDETVDGLLKTSVKGETIIFLVFHMIAGCVLSTCSVCFFLVVKEIFV